MPRPHRTRREIIEMVLISVGFATGLMFIVWGVSGAVTGREALGIPDAVEKVTPSPNDNQVLVRTEVFVDLQDGYGAELVIDGVPIETNVLGEVASPQPGSQVQLPPTAIYDPGNYSIRFQPQEDAAVEEWTVGSHVVTVIYWKLTEGRESARQWSWSFSVL